MACLMKQFTEAGKLQLQIKIDDEELDSQVTGKSDGKNEAPPQSGSRAKNDGTLEMIIFLTVLSLIILLWSWDNIGFNYLPLMVALMLLFNHTAFVIAKEGRIHRLMKTIARV